MKQMRKMGEAIMKGNRERAASLEAARARAEEDLITRSST